MRLHGEWFSNPPLGPPSWWCGDRWVEKPMPGTDLPCGCFLRVGDSETFLCPVHLAELNGFPESALTQMSAESIWNALTVQGASQEEVRAVMSQILNKRRAKFEQPPVGQCSRR